MKKLTLLFLLATGIISQTLAVASNPMAELSESDAKVLGHAVWFMVQGMPEEALTDLDSLLAIYPHNYIVQYERLCALYCLKRYDEVVKHSKYIFKNKDVTSLAYQLCGNAYSIMGKPKDARKTYEKGLKKFPGSGELYLELGNLDLHKEEYNAALLQYNKGIQAAPNFASNYYRAAQLYFNSRHGKVWGLIYAETEILLAPQKANRHREMAQSIRDCYLSSITVSTDSDSLSAKVSLVPQRGISVSEGMETVYLDFPGIYEGCTFLGVTKLLADRQKFTASIAQLTELRRSIVESYFSITNNLYGNSMYLFPFQKKIIDAGHWEAYNQYLFSATMPEEFNLWRAEHEEQMQAFIEWFNQMPFHFEGDESVGVTDIFKNYPPLNLMEGFLIQEKLLGMPEKELEDNE